MRDLDEARFQYRKDWLLIAAGMIAMVFAALFLDARTVAWVQNHSRPIVKAAWWAKVAKSPGHFAFTGAVAAVVMMVRKDWRPGAALVLAAAIEGASYSLIKWSVGRTRPFKGVGPFELHPFVKGFRGLLKAEDLAFPSGHAGLAFSTAAVVGLIWPRWWWAFYLLAAGVGVERVMEGAHYPSDVAAAMVVGVLSGVAAWRLLHPPAREAEGDKLLVVPENS
jgi:membrane-associated phospholipid phosphatase